MAVAFDAVGPSAAGTSTNGMALSWSHTATGTNLLVVAVIAVAETGSTSKTATATYGGTAMVSVGKQQSNNGFGFVQMFRLVAPATGAQTLAVTITAGSADNIIGGSVSFTGVDQVTPMGTPVTAFNSAATISTVVASAAGNMIVDGVCNGSGVTSSNQTNRWLANVNTFSSAGNAASSTAAGAASVTMTYNVTSDYNGMIGVDVHAAAASGPTPFVDLMRPMNRK